MVGHAVEDTDALEVGVLGWVVGAAVCDTVGEVQAVALALGHAEGVREGDPEVDTLPVPNKDPVIEAQPLGEGEPDTERVGAQSPYHKALMLMSWTRTARSCSYGRV